MPSMENLPVGAPPPPMPVPAGPPVVLTEEIPDRPPSRSRSRSRRKRKKEKSDEWWKNDLKTILKPTVEDIMREEAEARAREEKRMRKEIKKARKKEKKARKKEKKKNGSSSSDS